MIPPQVGRSCPVKKPKTSKNPGNRLFFVMAPVVLATLGDSPRRSRAEKMT
jgi:hypothetical protein